MEKQLDRAHYVAVLWGHANTPSPHQSLSPTDYGWSVVGDLLQPTWFEWPAAPSPEDLVSCEDNVLNISDNVLNRSSFSQHFTHTSCRQ